MAENARRRLDCALSSMPTLLLVMSMLQGSPNWTAAATFQDYMTETQLARTEVRACKQGKQDGKRNFSTFMDKGCDSICNQVVRRRHLKKDCRVKEENLPFRDSDNSSSECYRGKGGKGKSGRWKPKENIEPDNKKPLAEPKKDRNCGERDYAVWRKLLNCYAKECKKPKKAVKQVSDEAGGCGHGDGEHQDLFAGEESD